MTIPATTGSLKTKLKDMEIGDYIIAKYSYYFNGTNNRLSGLITDIGFSNTPVIESTEVPYNGLPYETNGQNIFYLIKVAKGVLVADRVVQNSIYWSVLNTGDVIEGKWANVNDLIPILTSNTSGGGLVESSPIFNAYYPWLAFDKANNTVGARWLTTDTQNGWISYKFPEPKLVRSYNIFISTASADWNTSRPIEWVFEGSNNGTDWEVLDTRKNITWAYSTIVYFNFKNDKSFLYYRLNKIKNNGHSSYTAINDINMSEYSFFLRSLTGGISYTDSNKLISLTDMGLGAFPKENEWDNYIVNFPTNLIQSGKTLDDVFHWSSCATICKESSISGFTIDGVNGSMDAKVKRGYNTANYFGLIDRTTLLSKAGFRPVVEYIEDNL